MLLMSAALASVMTAILFVSLVYTYLFLVDKKNYLGIWALGWGTLLILGGANFAAHVQPEMVLNEALQNFALLISNFLFILGAYKFLEKRIAKFWFWVWGGFILFAVIDIFTSTPLILFHLSVIFFGIAHIWIGTSFMRKKSFSVGGRYIVGVSFVVWGTHMIDYPILSRIDWLIPLAYLITTMLIFTIAVGLLIIHFGNTKNELKQSEERLRRITDNTLDIICYVDVEGNVQYVSPSCKSVLGYEPLDIKGCSVFDDIHPDDIAMIRQAFKEVMSSLSIQRVELRYRHVVGYYIWLEVSSNFLFDSSGNVTGAILCGRDITLRKQAEEASREKENKFQTLFNNVSDAIFLQEFTLDGISGTFIEANQKACEMLGYSKYELLDKSPRELDFFLKTRNKERIQEVSEKFIKCLLNEKCCTFETVQLAKDGTKIPVEIKSQLFVLDGKKVILSVARDITERKAAEDLRVSMEEKTRQLMEVVEVDKLKSEFFANLSHELRTPLNIILGTLQLFDMYQKENMISLDDLKMKKHMKAMKQNCNRLLRLVNNLIDITRIDSGYFHIHLENCNIIKLVEDITLSVAEYIENKGISLQFDTDLEEKIIACDPDKIERMILNLLSNAVKFTPSGASIYVDIKNEPGRVVITVKDEGIGIPKDKLEYIFERFRQVDKSLTRNHEGSGIGLALVKSLVEMHGGKIRVHSELGKGSEFVLEIPDDRLEDSMEKGAKHESTSNNGYIERINIEFSDIYT